MGYNLTITRADDYFDEASLAAAPITFEEWCRVVEEDREMVKTDEATADCGEQGILVVYDEGLAFWAAYSKDEGPGGGRAWFCWEDGKISVKSPDVEIIRKMVEIAHRLGGGAYVVGEEDEWYDENAQPHYLPESAASPEQPDRSRDTSWWKRWFRR